jgi:hypothetical protein
MKDDEVAERGGEASSSKSWNAESREMASMPFGSDVEGAAEAEIWCGRYKSGVGEDG